MWRPRIATRGRASAASDGDKRQAIERIQNSERTEVIVLYTIPLPEEKRIEKIKILSTAPLFASAIEKIFDCESVSVLFSPEPQK